MNQYSGMWICERSHQCDSKSCLEKQPHKEKEWCKSLTLCDEKKVRVKCVKVSV